MQNISHIPHTLAQSLSPITIICGHYGVGKTNFTLNLALDIAKSADVCVIDLDIVNPYFRTSEYSDALNEHHIKTVTPVMANSSLDSPSLSAQIDGAIAWAQTNSESTNCSAAKKENPPRIAIMDVGGDDVGAKALGRYAQHIKNAGDYSLIYVINAYRSQTQSVQESLEIMREIEHACNLRVNGVVNNSHLKGETTLDTVLDATDFGVDFAKAAGVPLLAQTCPARLFGELSEKLQTSANNEPQHKNDINFFPSEMLVKTPWE